MHPCHDRLAPSCTTQAQRLVPHLPLVLAHSLDLLLLLFPPAFFVFEVARSPLVLSRLVDELGAVFLEQRHGVEGELVVRVHEGGGAGHDPGGHPFIGLDEVFRELLGDRNELGLEVLGVFDDDRRVDDGG